MKARRIALNTASIAAAGVLLTSCSSSSSTPAANSAVTTTTAAAAVAPASSSPAAPAQLTADQIIAKFKAAKLPIGTTLTYTAADDPNHLLGRPNGYLSKTSWTDTRINADQANDNSSGSVDLGGSVEMYATAALATARKTYIQSALAAAPMLGTEYDYVVGTALVRVSSVLTPTQAQAYQAAAE